ncbi:MAG: GNAT family N-acetyltransferase [Pseudomonadota bacterium]
MRGLIQGKHLYLRGLVESDASGPYPTWLNDREINAGNSHGAFPYATSAALDYIRQSQTRRDALILAIVLNEGDRHIGNISLQAIHPVYRSAELALLIGERDCWGKGYGREAASLICRHGFETLNLHRIHCGTFAHNNGMQSIAKALGMRQEGVRRQAAYKDGHYVDVIEYGLLRDELRPWPDTSTHLESAP